jgi:hypothetical protein
MGLLDPLRRLFTGGDEDDGDDEDGGGGVEGTGATGGPGGTADGDYGPDARSYVETGGPPSGAPEPERDGRLSVLVTSNRDAGPEGLVETDDLEARIAMLGGEVDHAHGGGTVSAWLPTDALAELAEGPSVARIEVTIPDDGGVREDPEFQG